MTVNIHPIFKGYYTVDCTIPKYVWTSAQMTLPYWTILDPKGKSNMVKSSGTSPNIFRYCTVNCIITFLLYIQLFKVNATLKLHFVRIVLPCKQQNVT